MASRPLRITHIIPQIGIGGAELQLCSLISRTPAARAAHRVLYYSDSLDEAGFDVYRNYGVVFSRVERRKSSPVAFLRRLARTIARERPDIIHCWLPGAALWGRWAAILARAERIVLSFRSTRYEQSWLLRVSRLADNRRIRYLVNSSAAAEALARGIGAPRGLITVIPNGIELDEREPPFPRETLLRDHGCPPGTRMILTVGRLTEDKNYPMLLRIAARCRGRLPVHFFLAGHGELETDLKNLARQMEVTDIVHFLGLRRDVSALLRTADLFCFTSRNEGFPNALLEAMAAARPIVTTKFAGVEDLIEPGMTARVVEQDDDKGAFEAVRALLEDPVAAAAMGAAARQTVEVRFGMDRMVGATLEYYERIMRDLA